MSTDTITDPTKEVPSPGSVWRHYKGGLYRVVSIGHDALGVGGAEMVIYTKFGSVPGSDDGKLWVRPLYNWHAPMALGRRFMKVSDP